MATGVALVNRTPPPPQTSLLDLFHHWERKPRNPRKEGRKRGLHPAALPEHPGWVRPPGTPHAQSCPDRGHTVTESVTKGGIRPILTLPRQTHPSPQPGPLFLLTAHPRSPKEGDLAVQLLKCCPVAAVTKWEAGDNGNLFLHRSGGQMSRIKVSAGPHGLRRLRGRMFPSGVPGSPRRFWACRLNTPALCLCLHIPPFLCLCLRVLL